MEILYFFNWNLWELEKLLDVLTWWILKQIQIFSIKMKFVQHSPYTTRDASRVMNTNELVAGGSDVKVRLLLVDEEGVRYPDVLDELRADAQRLDARSSLERESRVRPELPEVKIQREVLARDNTRGIR